MCFRSKQRFKTREEAREFGRNPKIAGKDIVAYKVLNAFMCSPYRGFSWELNKLVETKLGRNTFNIDSTNNKPWILEINRGLHAYRDMGWAKYKRGWLAGVYKVVIPKGAEYFINENEIVANRMIIKKKIC